MTEFKKGENCLFKIIFSDEAGNEISYSDITALEVSFMQSNVTITTYTKASSEVREGDSASEVEVELTASVSNTLTLGKPLSIKYKISITNADFDVDGTQTDIILREYFSTVS